MPVVGLGPKVDRHLATETKTSQAHVSRQRRPALTRAAACSYYSFQSSILREERLTLVSQSSSGVPVLNYPTPSKIFCKYNFPSRGKIFSRRRAARPASPPLGSDRAAVSTLHGSTIPDAIARRQNAPSTFSPTASRCQRDCARRARDPERSDRRRARSDRRDRAAASRRPSRPQSAVRDQKGARKPRDHRRSRAD